MNNATKTTAIITSSLFLLLCMSMSPVSAQQTVINDDVDNYVVDQEPLAQAPLDQILAPIALYPDSLLSQILVAATYPLEVVQAARWRQANTTLTEQQVLAAIEDMQWDPSVKALTPFTDLIARLSQDLDWLQQLGDAFLQNEYQVLASVQELRQKAHDAGSIADNDYYDVVTDNDNIIIESTNRETVYVPYYDSRVVYGRWGWNDYQPVYWNRPSHYRQHAGFYWSDRFYIRPTIFFGGFHWGSRNLVVNHHFYDRPYSRNSQHRNLGVSNYRRWNHNPRHRRGVRYSRNSAKNSLRRNQTKTHSIANRQTRARINERRGVENKRVSNNYRNRTNNNRTERRGAEQRHYTRTQKSVKKTTRKANAIKRETKRRSLNINRSSPRQQSARQSTRNNSKANRRNNKVNSRSAAVAKTPSKKTNITRNNNSNKNNSSKNNSNKNNSSKNKNNSSKNKNNSSKNKSNSRSSNRNTSRSKSRYSTSNNKSRKQRN